MDRRLGRPLPHQLPNQTRVHLIPPQFFTPDHAVLCAYAALAAISNCYSPVWGRLPTRYSPVRRSVKYQILRRVNDKCFARLACVKHAASVHPEPGSNSLIKCLFQFKITTWLSIPFTVFWFFKPFLKMNVKEFSFSCVSLFNYQGSCRLTASIFYHIVFCLSSTFLKSFFAAFRHLCSFATAILDYHICISLSRTFLNFFQSFSTASLSFCDS